MTFPAVVKVARSAFHVGRTTTTKKKQKKGRLAQQKSHQQRLSSQQTSLDQLLQQSLHTASPAYRRSSIDFRVLWHAVPSIPLVANTVYQHYSKGPAGKSWSLSQHLVITILRDFLEKSHVRTVEDIQRLSQFAKVPLPSGMHRTKLIIPLEYRKRAGHVLDAQLSAEDQARIGWDWQQDCETSADLKGEQLEVTQKGNITILFLHGGVYYLGSYGLYRQFLSRIAKMVGARTVAVDYRLAPQHPFPAAVEDVLATYLYLIDPPAESGREPIDPSEIVISGDSAGGGLTFALLLAIRNAGLPLPAGAMSMSPWLDLTHSFPSIITNMATDYLPAVGFRHAPSPALDYSRLPQRERTLDDSNHEMTSSTEKQPNNEEEELDRIHFYTNNECLKHPLVSPIFDPQHLRNLPPMLIQAGDAERLRDESIYAALLATGHSPTLKQRSKDKPTHVTLELYADQPHVFQVILPTRAAVKATRSLADFAHRVTHAKHSKKSATHENEKPMADTTLRIQHLSHHGDVLDVTADTVHKIRTCWHDWATQLEQSSLKQRLHHVHQAYDAMQAKAREVKKKGMFSVFVASHKTDAPLYPANPHSDKQLPSAKDVTGTAQEFPTRPAGEPKPKNV